MSDPRDSLLYLRLNESMFCIYRLNSKDYMDDLEWHHYCLTFNGKSGLFSHYFDGNKVKSQIGLAVDIPGGGTLSIAGTTEDAAYQMSWYNLWDSVLPPDEIKNMATSCLKGIGNIKNWFDFHEEAKARSSMTIIKPSVCVARPTERVEN